MNWVSDSEEALIRRLGSRMAEERFLAWDELFGKFVPRLHGLAPGRLYIYQDVDDLSQDFYLRVYRRLQEEPLEGTNPKAYIWTVARNLVGSYRRNYQRWLRREAPLDEGEWLLEAASPSPEQDVERKEVRQQVVDACLRLPHRTDGLLFLLHLAGYSSQQITSLLPVPRRTLYRHLQDARVYVRQQVVNPGKGMAFVGSPRAGFPFDNQPGPFGLSFMNAALQNLAPESQRELCKTFGLKNISQLAEVCFVMLVLHNVNTPEIQLHIDFLPREDMGWRVVEGKPMHYLDMNPSFRREKIGGVWQEVLSLEDQVAFSAREINKAYDDQGGLAGTNWRFDFPQGPLTIYKPLDPHQFLFYSDPKTRRQSLFVFKPVFR